jgi:hypothetical protein
MDALDRPLDPVALALLLMFGSLIAGMAVGVLVGWRTRFEAGAAIALLAFGSGGLAGAGLTARHFQFDTAVVTLPASGCSERPDTSGQASVHSTQRYGLVLPDGRELTLVTPEQPGPCERTSSSFQQRLRYPLAAARSGGTVAAERETDTRAAHTVPWVFVAFGSFGLLGGLVMLAQLRADARRARLGPAADVPPAVGPGRTAAARWFTLTANVLVLVAGIGTVFSGDEGQVSAFRLFESIAVACACYALAFALRGVLRLETFLILLIIGGGFGAAGWSVLVPG